MQLLLKHYSGVKDFEVKLEQVIEKTKTTKNNFTISDEFFYTHSAK